MIQLNKVIAKIHEAIEENAKEEGDKFFPTRLLTAEYNDGVFLGWYRIDRAGHIYNELNERLPYILIGVDYGISSSSTLTFFVVAIEENIINAVLPSLIQRTVLFFPEKGYSIK